MSVRLVSACAVAGSAFLLAACGTKADAPDAPGVTSVKVDLSSKGCLVTPSSITAGPTTFHTTNTGSGTLNEAELQTGNGSRILAEKENLTPGLDGSFSYDLSAGTYIVQCLGGAKKKQGEVTFRVNTAPAAASAAP